VRVIPDNALGNGALIHELNDLIRSPDTLKELALNSANIGRPDAADHIAAKILNQEGAAIDRNAVQKS
jgi:UDP-N-acetylglucosamine:LPS N-acetylglucosamine transferase